MRKPNIHKVFHLLERNVHGQDVAMAVFTSEKLLHEYVNKWKKEEGINILYRFEPHTVEIEPAEDNFNVPLDPKTFVRVVKSEVAKASEAYLENAVGEKAVDIVAGRNNPYDPKPVDKSEPVSALLGIKVGRKGTDKK